MITIPTNKDPQTILSELSTDDTIPKALALKAMDIYGRQCYENKGKISYSRYRKSLGADAVCGCEYPTIKMLETPICTRCGKKVDDDFLTPYKKA